MKQKACIKQRVENVLKYVLLNTGNSFFHENYYLDKETNQFLPEDEFQCGNQYVFMINRDVVNEQLRNVKEVTHDEIKKIADVLVG